MLEKLANSVKRVALRGSRTFAAICMSICFFLLLFFLSFLLLPLLLLLIVCYDSLFVCGLIIVSHILFPANELLSPDFGSEDSQNFSISTMSTINPDIFFAPPSTPAVCSSSSPPPSLFGGSL